MNSIQGRIWALIGAVVLAASVAYSVPQNYRSGNQLEQKIRKELVKLPYYGVFDNLSFSVNGGTVTLYGQVVKPTTKSDAEHSIARVAGVSRVINRIEVLPLSSFDDSLRQRTYRAVFSEGGLYRYALGANPSIHIIVSHGHVTLEGVVANRGDAQRAYIAARTVPGSFSVTNHLRIEEAGRS